MQSMCRRYQIRVAPCQADLSADRFDIAATLLVRPAELRSAYISHCSGFDTATGVGIKLTHRESYHCSEGWLDAVNVLSAPWMTDDAVSRRWCYRIWTRRTGLRGGCRVRPPMQMTSSRKRYSVHFVDLTRYEDRM